MSEDARAGLAERFADDAVIRHGRLATSNNSQQKIEAGATDDGA